MQSSDAPVADRAGVEGPETTYGPAYYQSYWGGLPYERSLHWLEHFDGVARRIATDLAPRRALDAGCAMGLLVEALRNSGVEAFGVDVSPYAINQVDESVWDHCRVASLTEPLDRIFEDVAFEDVAFDLVICLETLEHLEAPDAEVALDNLCGSTDRILFSSSPTDYGEPTHLNLRPPEVWSVAFARRGFFRDVDFDASFLAPWAVLYRRGSPTTVELVRAYDRELGRAQLEVNEVRRQILHLHQQQEGKHGLTVENQALRARAAQAEDRAGRAEAAARSWRQRAGAAMAAAALSTGWSAVTTLRRRFTRS